MLARETSAARRGSRPPGCRRSRPSTTSTSASNARVRKQVIAPPRPARLPARGQERGVPRPARHRQDAPVDRPGGPGRPPRPPGRLRHRPPVGQPARTPPTRAGRLDDGAGPARPHPAAGLSTRSATSRSIPRPPRCSSRWSPPATNALADRQLATSPSAPGPRSSATPSRSRRWSTASSTTPRSSSSKATATGSRTDARRWPPGDDHLSRFQPPKPSRFRPPLTSARMVPTPTEPRYLRTAQVAELLHVSPKTVSRWAQDVDCPISRTLGGHRRYPDAEIQALLETLSEPSAWSP